MEERVATLIIEPCSLVCEALVSLMASHSYYVVGGVASTADIDSASLVADVPKLVILGALPAEEATTAASCIRKLWPKTKIVLLFERTSSTDFQNLSVSEIDGCVPLLKRALPPLKGPQSGTTSGSGKGAALASLSSAL